MRVLQLDMPRGASGMTARAIAQAPTLAEVRQGAYTTEGTEREQQFETAETPTDLRERRATRREARTRARTSSTIAPPAEIPMDNNIPQAKMGLTDDRGEKIATATTLASDLTDLTRYPTVMDNELQRTESGTYPNGYKFPEKHTNREAIAIGSRAFVRFTFGSIFGFLVVFYCIQIVGWGGMIFILLTGG